MGYEQNGRGRTQQERRAATSGKLLKATIDLLLEKGYSGFRIVDAAARAKVSRGAQSHHFATKNELIEAAIENLFASKVGQAQIDAAKASDTDLIEGAALHAEQFLTSKLYRVSFNMLVSVGDQLHLADGVRDISARSRAPIERAWADRVENLGVGRSQVETLLSLLWSVQRGIIVTENVERAPSERHAILLNFVINLLSQHLKEMIEGGLATMPLSTIESSSIGDSAQARDTQGFADNTKREQLLNAAFQILRDEGHAGLRSVGVSELSGVSRGGMLHHFPTKEALVAAVYERIVNTAEQQSWQRIEAVADGDDVCSAIIYDAQSRFFADSYKVILDILVASAREQPFKKIQRDLAERHQPTALAGWAGRLAASGVDLESADLIAQFLWYMVKGISVRELVMKDQQHRESVLSLGLNLARRELALRAAET